MTSNNSGWIMGAPKEAAPIMWQQRDGSVEIKLDYDLCREFLHRKTPCYRHRPIKKEDK